MDRIKQIGGILGEIKERVPLVHHITNYVTVNDCANVVLAIGASPIMADDVAEVEEIVSIADALVLNMGTLNQRTVASMISAGKRANSLGIPVIFDPVGAGASRFRSETARKISESVKLTVLRGNLSEVSFMAGLKAAARGVDTALEDEKNDPVAIGCQAARQLGCVAAVTGAVDVITDGKQMVKIHNGHPMLSKVTGTGCMTSSLVGAFAGAAKDAFSAAAGGVAVMGIAGELAYEKTKDLGTGSFRMELMNAVSQMDDRIFQQRAKLEEIQGGK